MVLSGIAHGTEQARHLFGGTDIDIRERLVEQQNARIVQDSACQRQSLAHALRILANAALERRIKPNRSYRLIANRTIANSV